MNLHTLYTQKQITADEAAKLVESGSWVDFGFVANTPYVFDRALAKRLPLLQDVKIRGGMFLRNPEIFQIDHPEEHFVFNSWHMGGIERKAIARGFVYYSPIRYSELPRYYRENIAPADVAVIQTAPMDAHGYFNFGLTISHLKALCETAKKVIVEVNPTMPVCLGGFENCIHISEVDGIIDEETAPVPELPSSPFTEIDRAVAKLIVDEIPNGACLQLGIGGMPNAVGNLLADSDLKDLGIHTEMYVDSFVDLYEAGKITGARKNIDRGRQVFAFAAGSRRLYDFLDQNPSCMAAPVNYTNDAGVISSIDNFISINNAIDFDLFGQVNAESSGISHISGAGGQLDFVLGAYASKGGKSFICCSSTYKSKDGTIQSRIRPTLSEGSVVTDTRCNVHYLVTEYGKVNVKGLSTWERAEKIIQLAHPDFRDELIKEAEAMYIWRRSNRR